MTETSEDSAEVIFLSRLYPEDFTQLSSSVPILIKAGLALHSAALPLFVLFQFQPSEQIYCCWINHHSTEVDSPLTQLVRQKELHFSLHLNSPIPERIISCPNRLNWAQLLNCLGSTVPWSMSDFDTESRPTRTPRLAVVGQD